MEEKKNNKGLVLLIVILLILVLGLVGYIFYDKVLLKDIPQNENNITSITTTNIKESYNDIKAIFKSLPNKNDESVLWDGSINDLIKEEVNFDTDFKNVSKNEHGFDLDYSCVEYNPEDNDEGIDKCTKFEIVINNQKNELYSNFWYHLRVMLTKEYLITYDGSFAGDLRIFDKTGKEIFNEYIATDFGIKLDEENYVDEIYGYTPSIKDNKLYFVKYIKGNEDTFVISNFDLSNKKVTEISNFKGDVGII
ncbi:MAG: hypothetical protein IJD92_02990 [Bacilli bacterium]|nr:hypothetical protein [Bacilli bacterium]